jgi:hypothetical protein
LTQAHVVVANILKAVGARVDRTRAHQEVVLVGKAVAA